MSPWKIARRFLIAGVLLSMLTFFVVALIGPKYMARLLPDLFDPCLTEEMQMVTQGALDLQPNAGAFDVTTAEERVTYSFDELEAMRVGATTFNPASLTLAVYTSDIPCEQIFLIDLPTNTYHVVKLPWMSWQSTRRFSPDGQYFTVLYNNAVMKIWRVETGEVVTTLRYSNISTSAFSPDSRFIALGTLEGVYVYDLLERDERLHIASLTEPSGLAFSENGTRLFAHTDDGLHIHDLENNRPLYKLSEGDLQAFRLHPTRSLVFIARNDAPVIEVWNTETGLRERTLQSDAGEAWAFLLHPTQDLLFVGREYAPLIDVWNTETGLRERTLEIESNILYLYFTPDDRFLVAEGAGNSISIWEVATLTQPVFTLHQEEIIFSEFVPNTTIFAYIDSERVIRFWDIDAGREVGVLENEDRPFEGLSFSADGRLLATVDEDRNVVSIWGG